MSRRPHCRGQHDWLAVGSKWKCARCPDAFPCPYDCGHVDCQDERGRPSMCSVCRTPVPPEDQFHFTDGRYHLIAHMTCCDQAVQPVVEPTDMEVPNAI